MNLRINGEARELPSGITLAELIERMNLHGRRLAVERNGEIVPRSQLARTVVAEGDHIEIVQAIGGG